MNDENEKVSLRDYIDRLLLERDKRLEAQMTSQQLAVDKAENATERRLGLLNEHRQQAKDESLKYALKSTVDVLATQLSRLYGGMLVIGAIGIANLVRMFFVHAP